MSTSTLSLTQLRELTDLDTMLLELKRVEREEWEVIRKLEGLVVKKEEEGDSEEEVRRKFFKVVESNKEAITELRKTTAAFQAHVDETASIATKVSNSVSKLATEQAKIKRSINLLKETQLLQNYLKNLQEAYQTQDYDTCLELCHHYLSLDYQSVVNSPFNHFLQTSGATKEERALEFEGIRIELVNRLESQAQSAIERMDDHTYNQVLDSVHKFPLVGEYRIGAKMLALYFSRSVSSKQEVSLNSDDIDYRDMIRSFLEEASKSSLDSIEILSQSYHHGWSLLTLSDFIGCIHYHLDQFQLSFRERRQLSSRLEEIHSSFQATHTMNRSHPTHQGSKQNGGTQNPGGKAELRELDHLLTDISFIAQKINLFRRLILSLIQEQYELLEKSDDSKDDTNRLPLEEAELRYNGIKQGDGGVGTVVQPILDAFPVIEKFYLARSVEKALELDEYEEGNGHSSSVDDTFYLIKKGSFRSLTSCDLSIFKNSIVIYASGLKELLHSLTPAASLNEPMANQGSRGPKPGTNSLRDRLVAINNASVSRNYLERLIKELKEAVNRTLGSAGFNLETQKAFHDSIDLLNATVTSFTDRRRLALDVLLDKAVSPKVQAFFNQISSDSVYIDVDPNNPSPIVSKFASRFNNFLTPFKTHFIDENFTWLIQGIAKVAGESLVTMVLNHRYDAMGILTLGEDLGVVTNYFVSLTEAYVKDSFARPLALLHLLESDSVAEAAELVSKPSYGEESLLSTGLKLTATEVRTVLKTRPDFIPSEIDNLDLSHLPTIVTT